MATITNEQLLRLIKKTGDIKQYEPEVKKVTTKSLGIFRSKSPKGFTGNLRSSWLSKKIGVAIFEISTNLTTQGKKKWNLAKLLNDGTERKTKKKGFFYIPLSSRARNKPLGENIPKEWKRGKEGDYLLVKSRAGIKASHFIDKEEKRATRELEKEVSKKVDKIIGR